MWIAYIAEVRISPKVEAKIKEKHNVTPEEVREAVVMTALDRAAWDYNEENGQWRLLVIGQTYAGRTLRVVLYPATGGDGVWHLGTAL